jgi:hypothetical protein
MIDCRLAAAFRCAARLGDDAGMIADQIEFKIAEPSRDLQRHPQRNPFRVLARAAPQIIEDICHAARDHRHFDPAGVGPASAVEEDFQPPRPRRLSGC